MTEGLILDLLEKKLVCGQVALTVGYDREQPEGWDGPTETDRYGRQVPKSAFGSNNLPEPTASRRAIMDKMLELYDRIVNPALNMVSTVR